MDEEQKVRLDNLYPDVMTVIHEFRERYDEPLIEDNIFLAVIEKIKTLDPTILKDFCPEINLNERGTAVQITYHRIH